MKPRFILVPDEIIERTDLTPLDKLLVAKIIGLDNAKHCYASNEALAKMIGVSKSSVSSSIVKMRKMGILTQLYFDGRKRQLSCKYTSKVKGTKTSSSTSLFES